MKVTKAAMFDVKLSTLVVPALKIRGSPIKENKVMATNFFEPVTGVLDAEIHENS